MGETLERTLRLDDGRELCFIRWNAGGGRPVLFCHGTPGSRWFRPPDQTVLATRHVDLVTVDRPGYGRSTPQFHRSLFEWPKDVAALTRHLGWERYAVAGFSGGGPHALACAFALPDRVTVVTVISSLAPFWSGALQGMMATTRRGYQLARWAPWLLRRMVRRAASNLDQSLKELRRELPECDRQILARPEVAVIMAENYAAGLSTNQMAGAMAHEVGLLRRAWGFALSDIRVPAVLWHGELDRNAPVTHGRRIAAALQNCRTFFVPNAGHYLVFDNWESIFAELTADRYWADRRPAPHDVV
jgi:pimeloyl-ACP methyl ester carboxylesterase